MGKRKVMNTVSGKKHSVSKSLWKYHNLYFMIFPAVFLVIVFTYLPIWGLVTAFFDYNPGLGFSGSPFVGFKHFVRFFTDSGFLLVIRNTLAISFLNISFGTVTAILFALLLNELPYIRIKKVVQTLSYLPHFVSFVVVANIAHTVLAVDGSVNRLLIDFGIVDAPVIFFTIPKAFWWIVMSLNIWKEMGWSAIIYIAAIASIDPALYEAARVDGAGRLQMIWHITLAGIRPTIVILLVLAVPELLSAGFDPSYLLGNAIVSDYSEVLDTFIYRVGLREAQYSFATAVGFFRQLTGLVLILSANAAARRLGEYSLF
jgi:putative aldouronate transport system permease protein